MIGSFVLESECMMLCSGSYGTSGSGSGSVGIIDQPYSGGVNIVSSYPSGSGSVMGPAYSVSGGISSGIGSSGSSGLQTQSGLFDIPSM